VETIQEFVDRTKGPLVPYVHSWYPWVYAHHYLRTEMPSLPSQLGKIDPRMTLDEAVELVQVWSGLTGESIEVSARTLADAYLQRWGVPREQIGRPLARRVALVPGQPMSQPAAPSEAPVSPAVMARMGDRPSRNRSVKSRALADGNGAGAPVIVPTAAQVSQPLPVTQAMPA
jgi:hypothetical protein